MDYFKFMGITVSKSEIQRELIRRGKNKLIGEEFVQAKNEIIFQLMQDKKKEK